MKTSKKLTSIILSLVMIFSMFAFSISAEAPEAGEYYNEGEYSIHYTVVPAEGEFKGRIMFLHGFLYSGTTWNGMAEVMSAAGYDCYLLDLPNFGYSTRETAETNHIDRETLVVNFMETIAPTEDWILAGHSMGGGVSLNIVCENDLEALMLFCPSEINTNGNSMFTSLATNKAMSTLMDGIFKAILSNAFIVKMAVYITTGDINYAMNYDASLLADPLMIPGTGSGMLLSSANAKNTDLEKIAAIDTPTLLVWADGDNVIGSSMVSNITGALSDAQVTEVEGSHIVIETAPDTLAQISLDFLSK